MKKTEFYTDNYDSLEEWIALRKENVEEVYPQFCISYKKKAKTSIVKNSIK